MLETGDRNEGPCLMEDSTSTIAIPTGWAAQLDENRNLILRRG